MCITSIKAPLSNTKAFIVVALVVLMATSLDLGEGIPVRHSHAMEVLRTNLTSSHTNDDGERSAASISSRFATTLKIRLKKLNLIWEQKEKKALRGGDIDTAKVELFNHHLQRNRQVEEWVDEGQNQESVFKLLFGDEPLIESLDSELLITWMTFIDKMPGKNIGIRDSTYALSVGFLIQKFGAFRLARSLAAKYDAADESDAGRLYHILYRSMLERWCGFEWTPKQVLGKLKPNGEDGSDSLLLSTLRDYELLWSSRHRGQN